MINSSLYIINTVKYNGENIALFAYGSENGILSIPIVRISDTSNGDTLFMGLIDEFINRAIIDKCHQIIISESNVGNKYTSILLKFGFVRQDKLYVKYILDKCIDSCELENVVIQNNIPISNDIIEQNQLIDVERKLIE